MGDTHKRPGGRPRVHGNAHYVHSEPKGTPMSQEARDALVDGGHLFYDDGTQKSDLQDESLTNTGLIKYLTQLTTEYGHHLMVTAVRTDHPTWDGGPDGQGHNAGCAIDCWPLTGALTANPNYLDAADP